MIVALYRVVSTLLLPSLFCAACTLCAIVCAYTVRQCANIARVSVQTQAQTVAQVRVAIQARARHQYEAVHCVPVRLKRRLMEGAEAHGYRVVWLGATDNVAFFVMAWSGKYAPVEEL